MQSPDDPPSAAADRGARWYPLAHEADLVPGLLHAFAVDDRRVVLCATREGLFALEDACTHAETRMSEGRLRGCRLLCPLHGAAFRWSDEVISYLVERGAKLDARDKVGRTPLTWASGVTIPSTPPEPNPRTMALIEKLVAQGTSVGRK